MVIVSVQQMPQLAMMKNVVRLWTAVGVITMMDIIFAVRREQRNVQNMETVSVSQKGLVRIVMTMIV